MPGALACILSYGLTCAPIRADVDDTPEPTPLEPAEIEPAVDELPKPPVKSKPPARGAASLVLAKVQSFYDRTSDLEAQFSQTYSNPVYGTKKVSRGTLKLRKPGLMVWDYADDQSPDFWIDEKTVYVVETAQKQVIKKSVSDSDIAGAERFLFGGRELVEDFQVKIAPENVAKQYGTPGHTVILLRPKKSNAYYKMFLFVVADGVGRIDTFAILNQDGSTNAFALTKVARNTGLSRESLMFKKPRGFSELRE